MKTLIVALLASAVLGCTEKGVSSQCASVWQLESEIVKREAAGQMPPYSIEDLEKRRAIFERAAWCRQYPQGAWF